MLHRNLGFKLLALALAVVLWFYLIVREEIAPSDENAPVAAVQGYPLLGEDAQYARAVPVLPQIEGPPPEGFQLVSVWTQPTVVALVGGEHQLRRMEVVYTESINLQEVLQEVEGEVEVLRLLVLPDAVSVLGDLRVLVMLRVEPLADAVAAPEERG